MLVASSFMYYTHIMHCRLRQSNIFLFGIAFGEDFAYPQANSLVLNSAVHKDNGILNDTF